MVNSLSSWCLRPFSSRSKLSMTTHLFFLVSLRTSNIRMSVAFTSVFCAMYLATNRSNFVVGADVEVVWANGAGIALARLAG